MPRNVGSLSLKTISALSALSTITCFYSIIATSQPVPLPAGSSIPSCSRRFRSRSMIRLASSRPSTRSSSRRAGRLDAVFAFRGRFVIAFRASPVPFPLAFSMFFGAYRAFQQSESACEGCSVPSHVKRPMPSLRSTFRFPARWARRVAFRGVGRGGRRGVLWKVSCETWTLPRAFLHAV